MSTVRSAGDRMLFREDFWNATMVERNDGLEVGAPVISDGLSGGQVAWYGKAHTYAFDRDLSIVVECISVASGSNQALLSIGTLAARRIEFGIDALGQPYAWGTAQVNLGLPVDDGPHIFAFSVNTYGNVTCVVDGVLWGTGTVVFGPLTTRMLAAGSCLGGLDWGATVRPIRIYGYAADYATLVSLCGLPASAVWTPDLMLVGRDGLYEDLDAAGAVTLNTQPVPNDWDMEAVGTGAWTPSNTTNTKEVGSPGGIGNQVIRVERIGASANTYQLFQKILFNFYTITGYARGNGANAPAILKGNGAIGGLWAGTSSSIWQQIIGEGEENSGDGLRLYGGALLSHWCEYDDINLRNLSTSLVTCKGNKGNLAQATPASMTWSSDPQAPTSVPRVGRTVLYSDGAADHNVSTLAAAGWPLHQAPGFTYCEVITVAAAAAGNDTLIDSCNRSALSHGINANYDVTNKKLVVSVANGSGMFVVSEGMTIAPGKTITVDATWTAVDGLEVSVNGAPPMVQPTPPADKAILFDGINDHINMGNVLGFEWNQSFSISMLLRNTVRGPLILSKCGTAAPLYGYYLQVNSSGKIAFDLRSNASRLSVNVGPEVDDGNIHHIVVTYDGSGTAAGTDIFIDGVLGHTKRALDTFVPASILNALNLYLASHNGTHNFYEGEEGDVTVFNKKLTVAEVTEIYNDGRPVDMLATSFAASVLAWWKMGEGDVYPTITDHSGNGYHGTMVNMAANDIVDMGPSAVAASATLQDGRTSGNADFFQGYRADKIVLVGKATAGELANWRRYTAAKYGIDTRAKACQFLGGTRHVRCGNVLGYERTNQFSVGFWIKLTGNAGYVCAKADANQGWGVGNDNGQMLFSLYAPGAELRVRSTTDLRAAGWRFATFAYDGSSLAAGVTFYLDGVASGSTVISDTIGANTLINAAEFNIGGRTNGSVILDNAVLDEVSIWGKALTPAEVVEIHSGGLPINLRTTTCKASLAAWWRMGDSDVFPQLLDSSGSGYHGTMTNMLATDIIDRV